MSKNEPCWARWIEMRGAPPQSALRADSSSIEEERDSASPTKSATPAQRANPDDYPPTKATPDANAHTLRLSRAQDRRLPVFHLARRAAGIAARLEHACRMGFPARYR